MKIEDLQNIELEKVQTVQSSPSKKQLINMTDAEKFKDFVKELRSIEVPKIESFFYSKKLSEIKKFLHSMRNV